MCSLTIRCLDDTINDKHYRPDTPEFLKQLGIAGTNIPKCFEYYYDLDRELTQEEMERADRYRAPLYCAQMLAGIIVHKRKNALVLDVCAGKGEVGRMLKQVGFQNIHAHDGSADMLDICRQTSAYSKYICCMIEQGKQMPISDCAYDAVTTAGSVMDHHLPPSAQAEFCRITKPGGFVIITYSNCVLDSEYGRAWVEETKRLEDEGVWRMYGRLSIPDFAHNLAGAVEIFSVQ